MSVSAHPNYRPHIVGIGGTANPKSSTERVLNVALQAIERAGGRVTLCGGAKLAALPMYTPGETARTPEQIHFIECIKSADGVLIATPAYHGGISGVIKNAIDLIEDLRDDARPYLHDRAIGCIVTAAGWQGSGTALASLRSIVHALRGWPTPLGVTVNSLEPLFDADGTCIDPKLVERLDALAAQVVQFCVAFRGLRHTSAAQATS